MQSFHVSVQKARIAHPHQTITVATGRSESSLRYQRSVLKIGVGTHGPSSMLYEGVVRRNSEWHQKVDWTTCNHGDRGTPITLL